MPNNVLGTAFIEIKPIFKGQMDASAVRAIEDKLLTAGTSGGAAFEKAIASAGARSGKALTQAVGAGATAANGPLRETAKEVDVVAQKAAAAADAQTRFTAEQTAAHAKLVAAQNEHTRAIQQFGKGSLQAVAAQNELSRATGNLNTALNRQEETAKRIPGGFARAGAAGSMAFSTIAKNSNGALGPLQEILEKTAGLGQAFQTAQGRAGKAMLGIGATVTGVGATLSVFGSADVQAQNQLKASIAGTGKSWDDYEKRVEETIAVGEKYGFTANQSMQALNRLTIATHSPDKALQAFNLTANIAAARHLDLSRAATKLGQSINGNTMGLRQFGISVSSGAKEAKAAAQADLAHEKAVTALHKAQQMATVKQAEWNASSKHTIASNFALYQTQENLKKAQENVAKTAEKASAAHKAASKTSDSFNQILAQGNKVMGGQAAAAVDTFTGRLKVFGAQVEDRAADVGKKFGGAITTVGPVLMGFGAILETGMIQKLAKGTKALALWKEESIVVQGATKAWTAVQWLFNAAMDANPIGIVVVAVAALVAGVVIAYNKFKPFHDLVDKLNDTLRNGLGSALHWVGDKFTELGGFVSKVWKNITGSFGTWGPVALAVLAPFIGIPLLVYKHWDQITAWLGKVWSAVTGIFSSGVSAAGKVVSGWWTDQKNMWAGAVSAVTKTVSNLWSGIEGLWNKATGWITGIATTFFNREKQGWTNIFNSVVGIVKTLWTDVQNAWNKATAWISSIATAFFNREKAGWSGIWHTLVGIVGSLTDDLKNVWNAALNWIGNVVSSWWTREVNGWRTLWTQISGVVGSLWNDVKGKFNGALSSITTAVSGWASKAGSWLLDAGGNMVGGLVSGIKSGATHALDAIKQVGSDIVNGVKDFFGIHSPSTVFAEIGGHLITGLIKGIVHNGSQVPHLIKSVFGDVASGASGALGWLEKQGGGLLDKVMSGAGNLGHALSSLFAGSGGGAGGGATGQWASTILQALSMAGAPASWAGPIQTIISHESGGNPSAINLTDSNAMAGHPSQGLMQEIPSTFAAYAGPMAQRGITDPLANIYGGIKYIMARYGSVFNVPGIRAVAGGGSYVGYNTGGSVGGGVPGVGNSDTVPALLTPGEFVIPKRVVAALGTGFFERIRALKFSSGGQVPGWVFSNVTPPKKKATKKKKAATHHSSSHHASSHHASSHSHSAAAAAAAARRAAAAHARTVKAAAAAHARAVRAATAKRAAAARAVAAARAKALSINMSGVTYSESVFSKNMKTDLAVIAKSPETFGRLQASLVKQAQATLATAAADERATRGTTKHTAALKARQTAVDNLVKAQKMINPNTAATNSISANFSQQFTDKANDMSSLFNYQAGYGASSAATVIAGLQAKVKSIKQFSDVLKQLAAKGVGVEMMQSLIAAGPQAGLAIANQLLSDPKSIIQIQQLESYIATASAQVGQSIGQATTARGLAAGGSALANISTSGGVTTLPSGWGPGLTQLPPPGGATRATVYKTAPTSSSTTLLSIGGDLVVRSDADLNKIEAALYQSTAAVKRATGMGL